MFFIFFKKNNMANIIQTKTIITFFFLNGGTKLEYNTTIELIFLTRPSIIYNLYIMYVLKYT